MHYIIITHGTRRYVLVYGTLRCACALCMQSSSLGCNEIQIRVRTVNGWHINKVASEYARTPVLRRRCSQSQRTSRAPRRPRNRGHDLIIYIVSCGRARGRNRMTWPLRRNGEGEKRCPVTDFILTFRSFQILSVTIFRVVDPLRFWRKDWNCAHSIRKTRC